MSIWIFSWKVNRIATNIFLYKIYEARDAFLISDISYIDLAKAFDKVSHSKCLNKLYYYGVSDNLYKLLKSYLLDRKEYVKLIIVSLNSRQLYMVFLKGPL